jgi:hypothetical protein
MSTETYRLTFYEQGKTNSGKRGLFYVIQYFTYFHYLGYHIRMHYEHMITLGLPIQVSLTGAVNTSLAIAIKNKVSTFSTQSFNKKLFLWLRLLHKIMRLILQRWIKDWT